MSTIGPGSMLLCVRNDKASEKLVVGTVYECAAVLPGTCRNGCETLLDIVGVGCLGEDASYRYWPCSCYFVPAGRKGQFDHLLTAQPKREKLTARDIIEAADRILAE